MEWTVCFNLFTAEVYKPLFLQCGHSLCILCVEGLRKNSGQFTCPTCMQDIIIEDVNRMPVNYQLIGEEVIQQSPEANKIIATPCPHHPYKSMKLMCLDCWEAFCNLCISAHSGHKIDAVDVSVNRFIDTQLMDLQRQKTELFTDLLRLKERNEQNLTRNDVLKSQIVEIANSAMRRIYNSVDPDCQSAMQRIKDQKEYLLIQIAETEKTNESKITSAEFQISDINSKFNELREFKNTSYANRVNTFKSFKEQLITVQPIDENLTVINYTPSEVPPNFIGSIEETIISTKAEFEAPQLDRQIQPSKQQLEQWTEPSKQRAVQMKLEKPKNPKQVGQQIDLAIFHSAPLIQKEYDRVIPLNESSIDFEAEKQYIQTLERNAIGADIRFDAVTTEKFMEVLDYSPKIIHISCGGGYKDHKFYLAFEHATQVGVLDFVDEERLRKLLNTTKKYEGIIYISVSYSAAIAQTFLDAGFPCVICVDSRVKILDVAATWFASAFYRTILQGKTVKQSFESAKALVEDQETTMHHSCCCLHTHRASCKWLRQPLDADEKHEQHIPNCNCNGKNRCLHDMDCKWAIEFMEKFGPDYWTDAITDEEWDSGKFIVCCCSPELPHGEGEKFALMIREESFLDKYLFPGHTKTEIQIVTPLPESLRPPYPGKQIIGRNTEIYKIVETLSSQDDRFIFLSGDAGLGKSDVLKTAAMYAFERRVFTDGVVYCDLNHRIVSSALINTLVKQLNLPGISKEQLVEDIRYLHLLIIFDNSSDLLEATSSKVFEQIRYLVENTRYPNFVIVSNDKYYCEFAVEIHLSHEATIEQRNPITEETKKENFEGDQVEADDDVLTSQQAIIPKRALQESIKMTKLEQLDYPDDISPSEDDSF